MNDDEVIYLFHLFRGEPTHNCLEYVVIVVLVVEAAQIRVTLHESQNFIIVVPDNRVLSRGYFLEHKQPVMGKYLTVEYVGSLNHRYTALLPEPFVPARFLVLPVRSGESLTLWSVREELCPTCRVWLPYSLPRRPEEVEQ